MVTDPYGKLMEKAGARRRRILGSRVQHRGVEHGDLVPVLAAISSSEPRMRCPAVEQRLTDRIWRPLTSAAFEFAVGSIAADTDRRRLLPARVPGVMLAMKVQSHPPGFFVPPWPVLWSGPPTRDTSPIRTASHESGSSSRVSNRSSVAGPRAPARR